MPRYMRDTATEIGIAAARAHATARRAGLATFDVRNQHEPSVDGDRPRRVAGRIARVDRERLQPRDPWPVLVDRQRRRPVGAGLDSEPEDGKGGKRGHE